MNLSTLRALDSLEKRVRAFVPSPQYPDDKYVLASLREALTAAREGNFGVGAVIVSAQGEIVVKGHNRVFHPYFRSDLHAEMNAVNRFEGRFRDTHNMAGLALYTSLEPCPMCLARLITSGISKVNYAASDNDAGMVQRLRQMPPIWVELTEGQEFGPARCSPELKAIAWQIFESTAQENDERLRRRRIGTCPGQSTD